MYIQTVVSIRPILFPPQTAIRVVFKTLKQNQEFSTQIDIKQF